MDGWIIWVQQLGSMNVSQPHSRTLEHKNTQRWSVKHYYLWHGIACIGAHMGESPRRRVGVTTGEKQGKEKKRKEKTGK